MKQIRIVCTILLIHFVFIGNIGVNVFTHSCSEDGTFTSIIVKADGDCEDHAEETDACCDEEEIEDDCCKDEVKVYHVKFEYYDSYDLDVSFLAPVYDQPFFPFIIGAVTEMDQQGYKTRPPPKKPSGQKMLVLNQVFRI
jgi:hypothetical protein